MTASRPGAGGVSVVIPTLNEAARLPRLLESLGSCRPAPFEIVVSDGGSDDGTVEVARAGGRLVEAPRGRASQLQAGAEAARGGTLWFLHADTVPPPLAVGEVIGSIEAGAPGGCFRIAFPEAELDPHPSLRLIQGGINARTVVTRAGTGDQGIFVRRDVFDRVGGFPRWPLFEDVALSAAIRREGRPAICGGPLVTSARRWIRGGIARTMLRMWALRAGYLLGVSPETLATAWRHDPG